MSKQYHPKRFGSVGAAFRAYQAELKRRIERGELPSNAVSLTRTALLTYTVSGFGGPVRKGQRSTTADIEAAIQFLDTLPLDQLHEAYEAQDRAFNQRQVPAKVRKTNRYQLKLFLDRLIEQGVLDNPEKSDDGTPQSDLKIYRHSSRDAHKQGKIPLRDVRLTDRKRRDDFSLLTEERNPKLEEDMASLAVFEDKVLDHELPTIENYADFIYRMLGWLYRFQHRPLEQLSLQSLIPYTPLKVSLAEIQAQYPNPEEAMTKFYLRQQTAQQMAEHQAQEAEALIDDYCVFYQDSIGTQVTTLQALIAIAKWLYFHDTVNRNSKSGFNDIPIIRRLRQKLAALNKIRKSQPRAIAHQKRSVPWEVALEVIQLLQEKVETTHYSCLTKNRKGQPTVARNRRAATAIAHDLQKLLAICFFCFIPPDRTRTVAELEPGRTLIRGAFENGIFISMDQMSRPEEANWFINLTPDDYKTGKIYKDYCAPVDDIELAYGKTFYGYLQSWLEEYRPLFNPENHNRLFVKVKSTMGAIPGEPIAYRNMTSWIKYLFHKYTDVPVVPQSIRRMYVTFLKDSNASEAELEAAARAMHHSRAMQSAVYDQQELHDKLAPIMEFNQQVLRKTFQGKSKQTLPLTPEGQIRVRDLSDDQLKELQKEFRQEQRRRRQDKAS